MSRAVLVTGGGGYIGSRLLVELQRAHPDWALTALDDGSAAQVERVGEVPVRTIDVRDREAVAAAVAGTDAVVHLAAISDVGECTDDPDRAYEVNVVGTNNVAWACRRTGTALAFPFSMAVLGDPAVFPVTVGHERAPLNWYGRTKVLGERAIETYAEGAFPAHLFMLSNVYGEHTVDGTRVSKGTVINFFCDRALAGEPLTVYEPGTQARNFVHVRDVARLLRASVERLVEANTAGETGAETYTGASDEDPSVRTLAERIRRAAREKRGVDVPVTFVENPREEATVDAFPVDTSATRTAFDWAAREEIDATVRELLATDQGQPVTGETHES